MLASIPNKDSIAFREQVKFLFRVTDTVLTRQMKEKIMESYEDVPHYKVACTTLDEGFEDAFQYSSAGD
mgnify:CR=1 FL=1